MRRPKQADRNVLAELAYRAGRTFARPTRPLREVGAGLAASAEALAASTTLRAALLRAVLLSFLFAVVAAVFLLPLLRHPLALGIQDWDMNFAYHAVTRETIVRYRQFPLWTPYHAGGLPFLANPQTRILSPTILLVLATNAVVGMKLEIFLHYVIALAGAYALGRSFDLRRGAALLSAFVYALSGMLSMSVGAGMAGFLAAAYVPWTFYFFNIARRKPQAAVGAGVFLALMLLSGGVHQFALTLVALVLFAAILCVFAEQSLFRAARNTLIACFVGCGLSAVKLLPAIELTRRFPRVQNEYSGYSLASLAYSLFAPGQSVTEAPFSDAHGAIWGMSWGLDENGMYVGATVGALALVGLLTRNRHRFVLALTMAVLVWLSFGDRAPLSAWHLLHRLPVFDAMRVAQRFRFIWMAFFALFVGIGFESVCAWFAAHSKSTTLARLGGVVIFAFASMSLLSNANAFTTGLSLPSPVVGPPSEFRQAEKLPLYGPAGWESFSELKPDNAWSSQYPAVLQNVGTLEAYEPVADGFHSPASASSSPEYRGEVFVADGRGVAKIAKWTPNALAVEVTAETDAIVVVNQNYFSGWRASVGQVVDRAGLLAVRVPAGRHTLELRYLPTTFVVGAVISLCFVVAVGVVVAENATVIRSAVQSQHAADYDLIRWHPPRSRG